MIGGGNMENGNDSPATRRDLQDLRVELSDFKVEVNTRFEAFEHRMDQRLHDMETRILQAFYGYAEATNKRLNQIDGNVAIFINRLGTVENRLLEVEKRLNIPPAQ
jgi:hypothetical protein